MVGSCGLSHVACTHQRTQRGARRSLPRARAPLRPRAGGGAAAQERRWVRRAALSSEIALLQSQLAQQAELLKQKDAQLVQQRSIIELLKRSQTNISGMEPTHLSSVSSGVSSNASPNASPMISPKASPTGLPTGLPMASTASPTSSPTCRAPPQPPPFPEHLTRSLHRKPAMPPPPPPTTRCFAIDPVDLPEAHETARAPCRISGVTSNSSSSVPVEAHLGRGRTILSPAESVARPSGLSEDLELMNGITVDAFEESLNGVLRPSLMREENAKEDERIRREDRHMENERIMKQDDRDDLEEVRASDVFRDSVLDEMLQEMM